MNDNAHAAEALRHSEFGEMGRATTIPDEVFQECRQTARNLADCWAGGSVEASVSILMELLKVHAGYIAERTVLEVL